jgi:hypothetical protein
MSTSAKKIKRIENKTECSESLTLEIQAASYPWQIHSRAVEIIPAQGSREKGHPAFRALFGRPRRGILGGSQKEGGIGLHGEPASLPVATEWISLTKASATKQSLIPTSI